MIDSSFGSSEGQTKVMMISILSQNNVTKAALRVSDEVGKRKTTYLVLTFDHFINAGGVQRSMHILVNVRGNLSQ